MATKNEAATSTDTELSQVSNEPNCYDRFTSRQKAVAVLIVALAGCVAPLASTIYVCEQLTHEALRMYPDQVAGELWSCIQPLVSGSRSDWQRPPHFSDDSELGSHHVHGCHGCGGMHASLLC